MLPANFWHLTLCETDNARMHRRHRMRQERRVRELCNERQVSIERGETGQRWCKHLLSPLEFGSLPPPALFFFKRSPIFRWAFNLVAISGLALDTCEPLLFSDVTVSEWFIVTPQSGNVGWENNFGPPGPVFFDFAGTQNTLVTTWISNELWWVRLRFVLLNRLKNHLHLCANSYREEDF